MSSKDPRVRHYIGMVGGLMIAGLCGTCTYAVVTGPEAYVAGVIPLFVGGIPTVVGFVVFVRELYALMTGRPHG